MLCGRLTSQAKNQGTAGLIRQHSKIHSEAAAKTWQFVERPSDTHLSPGSDLPGGTLLLLARLHRLGFGRAAEPVV